MPAAAAERAYSLKSRGFRPRARSTPSVRRELRPSRTSVNKYSTSTRARAAPDIPPTRSCTAPPRHREGGRPGERIPSEHDAPRGRPTSGGAARSQCRCSISGPLADAGHKRPAGGESGSARGGRESTTGISLSREAHVTTSRRARRPGRRRQDEPGTDGAGGGSTTPQSSRSEPSDRQNDAAIAIRGVVVCRHQDREDSDEAQRQGPGSGGAVFAWLYNKLAA
jgi:hypothetical protein